MGESREQSVPVKGSQPGLREIIAFLGLVLLLLLSTFHFRVVQDDAFITLRYDRNFIQGNGLVYNTGERVEGYSNLLWLLLLALPARLGLDPVVLARIAGLTAMTATLYLLLQVALEKRAAGNLRFIAPTLLACNGSVAYWASSGMETALFSFLLTAGALAYLSESAKTRIFFITPALFFLLALTRPEGVLLFAVILVHFVFARCRPGQGWFARELRRLAWLLAEFGVPYAAFLGWRLAYYGSLLPNTYWAKVQTGSAAMAAGASYLWSFLQAYSMFGLLLPPIALLLWKRTVGSKRAFDTSRASEVTCWAALLAGQITFIMLVGGDSLPAFRFLVPVLPMFYLLVQEAAIAAVMAESVNPHRKAFTLWAYAALVVWTIVQPYAYLREMRAREMGLVARMSETGRWVKTHSTPGTVIACSTIGALGYYSEVTLIDMLGLTDAVIARQSQQIPGLFSHWKERRFNTDYMLRRKPDWIFFSTGIKPSAFAERALFTSPEFRSRYYPAYFHPGGRAEGLGAGYKRGELMIDAERFPARYQDVQFINHFYDGMNSRGRPEEARAAFQQAENLAPADFALLYQEIGNANRQLGRIAEAESAWAHALAIHPAMIESLVQLGVLAQERGEWRVAREHFQAAVRFNPEFTVTWTLLGEACLRTGNLKEASVAFRRAIEQAPDNERAKGFLLSLGTMR